LAIATRSLAIAALNVRVALEGVAVRRVVLKEDRVGGVSTALRPRTCRSAAYHASVAFGSAVVSCACSAARAVGTIDVIQIGDPA
jgi:hypothetical protein